MQYHQFCPIAKAAEIVAERLVVYVFAIGLDHGNDCVGRDEAGQVVDVAVRVVAVDALAEPDRVRGS